MARLTTVSGRSSRDEGFSLVEAMVALAIAAALFTMLSQVLVTNFQTTQSARSRQEAVSLGVESLEMARATGWEELAMTAVEPGDPRVLGGYLLASEVGLDADEELSVDAAAAMAPSYPVVVGTTTYEVRQYVTDVADGLRRAVVIVTWDAGSAQQTHQSSVLVAEVRDA